MSASTTGPYLQMKFVDYIAWADDHKKSASIHPVQETMFYTYVLLSKQDHRWYTGATEDLRKRFKLHQEGNVSSTKGRGPLTLIYYEACLNQQDAFAREKHLKSGRGKLYLKKRLKRFLS